VTVSEFASADKCRQDRRVRRTHDGSSQFRLEQPAAFRAGGGGQFLGQDNQANSLGGLRVADGQRQFLNWLREPLGHHVAHGIRGDHDAARARGQDARVPLQGIEDRKLRDAGKVRSSEVSAAVFPYLIGQSMRGRLLNERVPALPQGFHARSWLLRAQQRPGQVGKRGRLLGVIADQRVNGIPRKAQPRDMDRVSLSHRFAPSSGICCLTACME